MNRDRKMRAATLRKALNLLYQELPDGSAEWELEEPPLLEVISELRTRLSPRYQIICPLGVGGVGVVLKIRDTNLDVARALKFPRPRKGRQDLFAEAVASEISSLREAAHGNIIEVYEQDQVTISPETSFPFYIMEYIEGALDGFDYFKRETADSQSLLRLLDQAIQGLKHLHHLKICHGDVKMNNMLIGPDGHLVITDLGSARRFGQDNTLVDLLFTMQYAHPELLALGPSASPTDPNRMRAKIPRSSLRPAFDLYALGKNLLGLLAMYDGRNSVLDPYVGRYLRLMASRLLDGQNTEHECALGLPPSAFAEIKYNSIDEVADDIGKVMGRCSLETLIPEMDTHAIRTIQVSRLSPTPFTDRLAHLLSHPTLRRLAGVSQLGFISLVYPTATHSRLEHMLGTLTNVVRYCDALYQDPINPLFRQLMNEHDLKAVYLAALCHDLGQYPLAHDLEEADASIFAHEKIGGDLLARRVKSPEMDGFLRLIEDEWDVKPSRILARIEAIISADPNDTKLSIKDRILHTIIDGPIDADKVDYLVRDSENLNLTFGRAIDFDRLLRCLTVIFREQEPGIYAALGIHEKGKVPAETVAFARYAMFGTVYWHHTSRAAKAMLHRAVWEGLPRRDDDDELLRYRSELTQYAILRTLPAAGQQHLFRATSGQVPTSTQLAPTDRDMIEWLAGHTTETGRDLLEMIVARHLYKRLVVISKLKNARLWQHISEFRTQSGWKKLVDLENAIQHAIVEAVKTQGEGRKHSQPHVLSPSEQALVNLHEQGCALILVDVPTGRPGGTVTLEYLPEADRRDLLGDWKRPHALEDSVIWTQLHDSFLESAGKIRVFCHPDFRDAIEAALSKTQLESMTRDAVTQLGG